MNKGYNNQVTSYIKMIKASNGFHSTWCVLLMFVVGPLSSLFSP